MFRLNFQRARKDLARLALPLILRSGKHSQLIGMERRVLFHCSAFSAFDSCRTQCEHVCVLCHRSLLPHWSDPRWLHGTFNVHCFHIRASKRSWTIRAGKRSLFRVWNKVPSQYNVAQRKKLCAYEFGDALPNVLTWRNTGSKFHTVIPISSHIKPARKDQR